MIKGASILIQNRNMPESCEECFLCVNDGGYFCRLLGHPKRFNWDDDMTVRREDCPLTEVLIHAVTIHGTGKSAPISFRGEVVKRP